MPNFFYTRLEYKNETKRFKSRQNKSRSFEKMVMSYFDRLRPDCNIESNVTTGRQKKTDCFSVDNVCNQNNTVFEALGCY